MPMPAEEATESKQPNLKSVSSSSIWTTPEKGRLKLNFNGSSKSKSRTKSIGGVYRDDKGQFVLGYAQRIGRATSCVAELVALKRGLELAVENGWRDISIEGDSKVAIHAMASRATFREKKSQNQYTQIAAMLPQLGKTAVSHVLRKGNMVANGFAKLGHKEATLRLWRDIPPDMVLQHLEEDAPKIHSPRRLAHCILACLDSASCKATLTPPEAATESKRRSLKSGLSPSIWTPPKKGWLKLNFDGSTKSKSNRSSIGGVFRDHRGNFVLGYAQRIGRATSSMAELVALKRGLEIAVENGWRDISIEGDYKDAIDAMESRATFRAEKSQEQCREIAAMLTKLGKTTVSHVLRTGNRVANSFADLGHKTTTLQLWRDIPPDKVLQHLEQDADELSDDDDDDDEQSCPTDPNHIPAYGDHAVRGKSFLPDMYLFAERILPRTR